ncbi:MAG: cytochrome c biogenesis protein CcsA [candidate division Zixibacteria bacterium]|nr:cytochrome c biogenesis protein CcsA [candidate division Zixibacteria bacterium]
MDAFLHGLIMAGYLGSAVAYIRHFPGRQSRVGRYATGLLIAGLVFHSLFLIARTIRSGHLPFVGLHESMSFFAWLIALVYLALELRFGDRSLGTFVMPLVLMAQAVSTLLMRPEEPLPPLLRSSWFSFHVAVSFMAYAAFFFSFITGLLYVMQLYYLHRRRVGLVFSRLPSLEMLDEMNLKATSVGWVFLTVGIGTGVWWALEAWHSILPWLSDPKVFCVALTWVIYTVQLVARRTAGWQGQRAAYLALAGFASVLIAYIGAGLWTSVHIF